MTFRHIYTFEPHVTVVGMTVYRDKLMIATTDGLYDYNAEDETIRHLDYHCYRNADGQEMIRAYHMALPWPELI